MEHPTHSLYQPHNTHSAYSNWIRRTISNKFHLKCSGRGNKELSRVSNCFPKRASQESGQFSSEKLSNYVRDEHKSIKCSEKETFSSRKNIIDQQISQYLNFCQ